MSNDRFRNAVGQIDDRLLERCEAYEQQLPRRKQRIVRRWIAAAACFAVLIAVMATVLPIGPDYRNALFAAEDIALLFPSQNGGISGTTDEYQMVYVPNANALGLISVPQTDKIPVYQCEWPDGTVSKDAIRQFADGIFPALAQALGGTVPEYTVEQPYWWTRAYIDTAIGEHGVSASQYDYLNYLGISRFPWRSGEATTTNLHGHTVQADQSQSDEEIVAGLSNVRQILLDMLGVDFSDAKVVRMYDAKSSYGAVTLSVYFYDEDAHPLNTYSQIPVSNHVELRFYNDPFFMEDQCSLDVLQYVDICYRDWRMDATEIYQETGTASLISLKKAEKLLKKGYSFGGHYCQFCIPYQDTVDFTDYDFVSFIYLWNPHAVAAGEKADCIPFYVFYKHVGTADNGNEMYARTYVPAVAVSGLAEYFKNQEKTHTHQ